MGEEAPCGLRLGQLLIDPCLQALDLLGLKPTDAQRQVIRSRLRADAAGTAAPAGETAPITLIIFVILCDLTLVSEAAETLRHNSNDVRLGCSLR